MSDAQREMPRYKCHKVVWALKIAAMEFGQDGSATIVPSDDGYAKFTTKPNFRDRFNGSDDTGYFVVYEGGYQSWSPTKAFEDGYTKL
jgi:hypothetical protein